MSTIMHLSKQVKRNWLLDTSLFLSATVAILSGVYFLFLPSGGYQGGRNPAYGITILFAREVWEGLHDWGGLVMIAIALIHMIYHWRWIVNTFRRTWQQIFGGKKSLSSRMVINASVDLVMAVSFLVVAISGVYFFVFPVHSAPVLIFNETTWSILHTWSGVVMIVAAMAHFILHWSWVRITTSRAAGAVLRIGNIKREINQTGSGMRGRPAAATEKE